MLSAISFASISGFRTSSILTATGTPNCLPSSRLRFSISSPFFPMTTPGRAEKIVILALLAGLSIKTRETDAFFNFFLRYSRTFISSANMPAKSLSLAYQREDQLRLIDKRKPVGLIFCPIFSRSLSITNRNVHMARWFSDLVTATFSAGCKTPQRSSLLHEYGLHL